MTNLKLLCFTRCCFSSSKYIHPADFFSRAPSINSLGHSSQTDVLMDAHIYSRVSIGSLTCKHIIHSARGSYKVHADLTCTRLFCAGTDRTRRVRPLSCPNLSATFRPKHPGTRQDRIRAQTHSWTQISRTRLR